MLKQPLDQLPINLHLCVNETMGYFSFDNIENHTTYLMFNETKLLYVFLDYLQLYIPKPQSTLHGQCEQPFR